MPSNLRHKSQELKLGEGRDWEGKKKKPFDRHTSEKCKVGSTVSGCITLPCSCSHSVIECKYEHFGSVSFPVTANQLPSLGCCITVR